MGSNPWGVTVSLHPLGNRQGLGSGSVTPSDAAPRIDALSARPISREEHLAFLRRQRSASFLQVPAWGEVKSDWRPESVGWFRGEDLVGAGLVLYRKLPRLKRYLAYLPEGPVIDWDAENLSDWLEPMTEHLKARGAFGIRMGPPVVSRHWDAAAVKAGVADEEVRRLDDVPPTEREARGARVVSELTDLGWRQQATEGGFAAGQPQYNFQIPLRDADDKPRTEDDVLKGMNQQWRRNIKKAAKAGVETSRVPAERLEDELRAVPRPLRAHRRARRLHPEAALVLPHDVPRTARGGPGPDRTVHRRARG